MTGTVTRPGTLRCVVPSQWPLSEVSLASTQWMNLLHMSGSFRKTSKVGEFYIQSNAGRSRGGRRMSASEHAPQALADIVREPSMFTERGIGRGTDPFPSMSEARGHQMVFGSQYIYIKRLQRRATNDVDARRLCGESDGHFMEILSYDPHTSPLRQVMSHHAGKLGG